MIQRQTIRSCLRRQRQQLPIAIQLKSSLEANLYIANTPWFNRSRRIAFYQSAYGEPDLSQLMHCAWSRKKACYLPVCHPLHQHSLLFAPYFPDQTLQLNRYGILEPDSRIFCKPFTLDVVCMPLLAFDQWGNRLGSGKGYYDRTFAYLRRALNPCKPLLVGIAYDFQEVDALPVEDWDVPLDKIIVIRTSVMPPKF